MKTFDPSKNFTLEDVLNFRKDIKESIETGKEEQITKFVEEIDSMLIKKTNELAKNVIFNPSVRLKIDLKYFDSLRNIYGNRGFRVSLNKVEINRTYVNMGDFYDTECIEYDYYIVVGIPSIC